MWWILRLTSPTLGLLWATFFSAAYVALLWACPNARSRTRNDVAQVHYRFMATSAVAAAALAVVACTTPNARHVCSTEVSTQWWRWWGLSRAPYFVDVWFTLLLNSMLFAGVLATKLVSLETARYPSLSSWVGGLAQWWRSLSYKERLLGVREFGVGPLTEEVVYRVAACYFLHFSGYPTSVTYLLSSAMFSLAHAHHLYEFVVQEGRELSAAVGIVVTQMSFTFLFALHCAYLYMTTGSLLSVVLLHVYCNWLGPPSLAWVGSPRLAYEQKQLVLAAYVVGVVSFASTHVVWATSAGSSSSSNPFNSIFYCT